MMLSTSLVKVTYLITAPVRSDLRIVVDDGLTLSIKDGRDCEYNDRLRIIFGRETTIELYRNNYCLTSVTELIIDTSSG
ncbi:hypothetical protein DPMN_178883 [Dreissena polymorpha]|uniref:Uncharacterized protein n=1 Tax=Dreissena polymorpha TaxID=45954 RepID=A0A9D4IKA0_DREPO|nr:hypothetical protein DPMN_178883 [Dreissena polymorpha]